MAEATTNTGGQATGGQGATNGANQTGNSEAAATNNNGAGNAGVQQTVAKRASIADANGSQGNGQNAGNQGNTEGNKNNDAGNQDAGGNQQGSDGNDAGGGFVIPEAYKDKPWAAKIKSQEDLFKQIDNLDTLVGKKAVVPDFAKATPADVEAFNAQLRPADKAEYAAAVKMPETIPEADRAFYLDLLHDSVVRPEIANGVLEKFGGAIEAKKAEMVSQEDFEAKMLARFGKDGIVAGGPLALAESEAREHLNKADTVVWDEIPNRYLDVFYGVLNAVQKKYGATEGGAGGGRGGQGGSVADLNKQIDTVNQQIIDLAKRPHSSEEKSALIKQVQDLNVRLANADKKRSK